MTTGSYLVFVEVAGTWNNAEYFNMTGDVNSDGEIDILVALMAALYATGFYLALTHMSEPASSIAPTRMDDNQSDFIYDGKMIYLLLRRSSMKHISFLLSLIIFILPFSFAQTPTPTPSPTMIGDLLWARSFFTYDATDPDNPPLAGVLVTAAAVETASALTDENGNCTISVLAHDTGSVDVSASKTGYLTFDETYPGLPISGSITIALEQDPETTPGPTPDPTPMPVKGDVNGDGAIDIIDALLTAQYYVGLDVAINLTAADTNCDGSADIIDALLIAKYYVGSIESFC